MAQAIPRRLGGFAFAGAVLLAAGLGAYAWWSGSAPSAATVELVAHEAPPAGHSRAEVSDDDLAEVDPALAAAIRRAAEEGQSVLHVQGDHRARVDADLARLLGRAPAPAYLDYGGIAITASYSVS